MIFPILYVKLNINLPFYQTKINKNKRQDSDLAKSGMILLIFGEEQKIKAKSPKILGQNLYQLKEEN